MNGRTDSEPDMAKYFFYSLSGVKLLRNWGL